MGNTLKRWWHYHRQRYRLFSFHQGVKQPNLTRLRFYSQAMKQIAPTLSPTRRQTRTINCEVRTVDAVVLLAIGQDMVASMQRDRSLSHRSREVAIEAGTVSAEDWLWHPICKEHYDLPRYIADLYSVTQTLITLCEPLAETSPRYVEARLTPYVDGLQVVCEVLVELINPGD